MSRKIEHTFDVSVPFERVWMAMTDPQELNKWSFQIRRDDGGSTRTVIHGHERKTEMIEFEPMKRHRTRTTLTGREGLGVMSGVREGTVTFEPTESGTRITITRTGWEEGDDWDRDMQSARRGGDETIADLVLYLEKGVAFRRHNHGENSFHGIAAGEVMAGLQVHNVQSGTFADHLGLRPGDLLVELGGAGILGLAELTFLTKEHASGEHVEAAWVRDGELMRGSAELGARPPMTDR